MSNRLQTKIGRISLRNPVLMASGCFGYGIEMSDYTDLSTLGAVTLKTMTREPRKGNPPPRIKEVYGGIMSSIGLMNPGIDYYLEKTLPAATSVLRPDQLIASVGGSQVEDYVHVIRTFTEHYDKDQIAAIELNACCPNVKAGGAAFSSNPALVDELTTAVLEVSPWPVITKIIANFENMTEVTKVVEAAGADAIHLSISPMGIVIDIEKRKPYFHNIKAPLSGPHVKPIGVMKVWDLYQQVKIPIIASGGIISAGDALEYLMAGLSAVAIGAANFSNPNVGAEVVAGLEKYCADNDIENISGLVGIAHNY